jgi:DNA repair exonuclease SbcCD ATPase subunit
LSADDERAALAFAQEQHPELHALLMRLRGGRKGQYLTAVRQLHQTRERLERLRERTPDRYETSLAQWRIDSRLRLLVARMTMTDDPALAEELQELLAERTRLRLELLKQDRERLRSRLEKVESQIETLEADPAAVAQKDLAAIRRSLGIPTSANNPSNPLPPKAPRKKKPASAGP